jgi:hypothetical protein
MAVAQAKKNIKSLLRDEKTARKIQLGAKTASLEEASTKLLNRAGIAAQREFDKLVADRLKGIRK